MAKNATFSEQEIQLFHMMITGKEIPVGMEELAINVRAKIWKGIERATMHPRTKLSEITEKPIFDASIRRYPESHEANATHFGEV